MEKFAWQLEREFYESLQFLLVRCIRRLFNFSTFLGWVSCSIVLFIVYLRLAFWLESQQKFSNPIKLSAVDFYHSPVRHKSNVVMNALQVLFFISFYAFLCCHFITCHKNFPYTCSNEDVFILDFIFTA